MVRYYNFDAMKGEEIKVEGHPEWFVLTNFTLENVEDDSEERPVLNVWYDKMESEIYGLIDAKELKKQVLQQFKDIAVKHGYSPEAVKSIRGTSYYDDSFAFIVSEQFVMESDPFYRFSMTKIDNNE